MLKDAVLKRIHSGKELPGKDKLYDGEGLYLNIKKLKNGLGMYWRYDYTYDGKRKTHSYGKYPLITLTQARLDHRELRIDIARGINPSAKKRAFKNSESDKYNFKTVAYEWLERKEGAERHKNMVERYFNNDIFPVLGKYHIDEITPTHIVQVIERFVNRKALDQAGRIARWLHQIYRFAKTMQYTVNNPADIDIKMIIPQRIVISHPAITDEKTLSQLIKDIQYYKGYYITLCLLRLAPMLLLRPINLVSLQWHQIDFKGALITIEAKDLKNPQHIKDANRPDDALIVPLSVQAIAIFRELRDQNPKEKIYVFPHQRGKKSHMSTATINKAFEYLGYKGVQSAHGLRATARTLIEEKLGFDEKVIEIQLSHKVHSHNSSYDRTKYLDKRKEMMQCWGNFIDSLK